MRDPKRNKRVVVIGAGLGGMSAAIMLASNGFQVTILEKNAQVGGKLNQLQTKGFSFDLGPSIFTLPEIFRPIFEGDGKRLEDYITLQRVDPQWRNFFEDGVVVDLWEDSEKMRTELERFGPQVFGEYKDFLVYSRRQYEILERGYLRHGLDTLMQFFRFYGWKEARDLDYLHSMSGSIYKRLSNRLSPRYLRILHQVCRLQRTRLARFHEPDADHPDGFWPLVCCWRPVSTGPRVPQTA
jgi:diapolycopene oxygenase